MKALTMLDLEKALFILKEVAAAMVATSCSSISQWSAVLPNRFALGLRQSDMAGIERLVPILQATGSGYGKPTRERIGDEVHQGCCVNL
jgi:hypothetical protein